MEPTPQDGTTRSSTREESHSGWGGILTLLIGIWVALYIYSTVTSGFGWYIAAEAGFGLTAIAVVVTISKNREKHRAQAYAAAFGKIEEAAKKVSSAGSGADRARNLIMLRQAITDAGKIGAPSPISSLPDDSITTIDSSIGAIQAEAEYERGKAEKRGSRANGFAYVAGVFGILGFVVGVIGLFK